MILVVDDDVAMAETCSMFLEGQGFEVTIAGSGAEAMQKIGLVPPEMVISDCAMPGMSGLELSRNLRADPATAQLPVLLMSASLRCDVAQGPTYDGFLRKPFLGEALVHEVRRLLAVVASRSAPSAGT